MKMLIDNNKINTRIKIAFLWVSIMLCFVYADYFELYVPGKLDNMRQEVFGPLGQVNQVNLLVASILLITPSIMIAISVIINPILCRLLNTFVPSLYIAITLFTVQNAWYFYQLFGGVEILLLLFLIRLAVKWPTVDSDEKSYKQHQR